jgi:tRNA pseudouridine38-40 synthase
MEARASPGRSPLTDRFALFETKPLDLVSMNDASAYLVGEHDFATFGQPTQGESTIRRVYQAEWQSDDSNSSSLALYPGRRMVFTVTANAFLRQMARSLVGALLEVGRGHWSPADMQAALQARQRKQAAPPASPSGLVLERVTYPALFVSRDDSEE